MSDHLTVSVTSDKRKHFDLAMTIAFDDAPGGAAEAYRISPECGLVLYWNVVDGLSQLPYKMSLESAIEFVWGWLKAVDFAPYSQPDGGDGTDRKGFKVYTLRTPYAFVAIKPYYTYYGK